MKSKSKAKAQLPVLRRFVFSSMEAMQMVQVVFLPWGFRMKLVKLNDIKFDVCPSQGGKPIE